MSFGMWSIYKTKELLGYPHLATLHGKLGIAAVCLIFAGIIGGQLSFSMSPLYSLVPMETKATVKTLHRLCECPSQAQAQPKLQSALHRPYR